jgi:hypothetical protein
MPAPTLPTLDEFRPSTLRGAQGYVRVGQHRSGAWWFLDPQNRPFLLKAVAAVNRLGWSEGRPARGGKYGATVNQLYGSEDPHRFVRSAIQRLRNWNVNTLGAWSAPEFYDQGMFYTELIEFRKVGPSFHSGTALLPDVFDPAWRDAADTWARQLCTPRARSTEFIGYFTDHELGWAQPRPEWVSGVVPADPEKEKPSLLQICLSLEPSFRAYHAAWEFVLAPRQTSLEKLSADWGFQIAHREVIRQMTINEQPILTPGYLYDQRQFSREFAHRYFSTCASVIRAYDPNHLILGCRFSEPPGNAVLRKCTQPFVDVVSVRPERESWDRTVQTCSALQGMPVLLTSLNWADPTFARTPMKREARRLTSVERMLGKARTYLERTVVQRGSVGFEWSAWADADEDAAPFGQGLVHVDDHEAREHTELLADLNARAEALRVKGRGAAPAAQGS